MGTPASRIGDMHICPMIEPGFFGAPHQGGPVVMGSPDVFTGGIPQARVFDMCTCVGSPDTIITGSATVLVNGLMAARVGDTTVHGGSLVAGMPTVLIGG